MSRQDPSCPVCESFLTEGGYLWELYKGSASQKRDCPCGVEAWIRKTETGELFVSMFRPNRPLRVRKVKEL